MDMMVNSSYSSLFKFYFNNHDVIIVTHDLAHYTFACRFPFFAFCKMKFSLPVFITFFQCFVCFFSTLFVALFFSLCALQLCNISGAIRAQAYNAVLTLRFMILHLI